MEGKSIYTYDTERHISTKKNSAGIAWKHARKARRAVKRMRNTYHSSVYRKTTHIFFYGEIFEPVQLHAWLLHQWVFLMGSKTGDTHSASGNRKNAHSNHSQLSAKRHAILDMQPASARIRALPLPPLAIITRPNRFCA